MGNDPDSVRTCPNAAREGVTFFAAGSYIVRAMMARRRPARKRSAKGTDEAVPGDARAGVDERLLVEAAQSDPAKFDALYEQHFERVYAFVAGRVRDRAAAEDLTSEVFHKALANLPGYEWRGVPFAAWLMRIAVNSIVDQAKRAAGSSLPRTIRQRLRPIPTCKPPNCVPLRIARDCSGWWGSFRRFRSRWCTSDLWSSAASGRLRSGWGRRRAPSSNCNCARCRICGRRWRAAMAKRPLAVQLD